MGQRHISLLLSFCLCSAHCDYLTAWFLTQTLPGKHFTPLLNFNSRLRCIKENFRLHNSVTACTSPVTCGSLTAKIIFLLTETRSSNLRKSHKPPHLHHPAQTNRIVPDVVTTSQTYIRVLTISHIFLAFNNVPP